VTQESYIKVEPNVKKRAMDKLQKALSAKRKKAETWQSEAQIVGTQKL